MKMIPRSVSILVGAVLCLPTPSATTLVPAAVAGFVAVAAFTPGAEALPIDRARGRRAARYSRRRGRTGARYARQRGRQISRARRRGYYALPRGYRPITYGRYRYYYAGGRYYYPYMYGGRTTYVLINVNDAGNPLPPPPPNSIDIDFY